MHIQGKMVRQIIHAESTKDHILPGNAHTRQDGQASYSCSIPKDHIHPKYAQLR